MESAPMSTETETLRDKFAMAALTGMPANETSLDGYYSSEGAAERAYKLADAMLAERIKSLPQPEGRAALTAKWGG